MWVRRPPVSAMLRSSLPERITSPLVMVVVDGREFDMATQTVSGKEGRLLQNMLHSIGLSVKQTAVVCRILPADGLGDLPEALMKSYLDCIKPQIVLVIGQSLSMVVKSAPEAVKTILVTAHLHDLLSQPVEKRKAMAALMTLQSLLAPASSVTHSSDERCDAS
jgi:hypothetical protein